MLPNEEINQGSRKTGRRMNLETRKPGEGIQGQIFSGFLVSKFFLIS
jgi:hypothetical protein